MNWLLFIIIGYLAVAANAIVAPLLAWGDVRPDFLLLLLPIVAFLDGPNRGMLQAFFVGVMIDFTGASPPGIYATCTVLSLGIVRHFTHHSQPETSLGWLMRATLLMLLVPTFAVVWESFVLGVSPETAWIVSHVLAPVGWTLGCGIGLWFSLGVLKRLLPQRESRWGDHFVDKTPFFLSR